MENKFTQEQGGGMVSSEWKIKHRYECNYILFLCLKLYNYQYGAYLRFNQMLQNLEFIDERDRYSEESYDTIINNLSNILRLLNEPSEELSESITKNAIIHWLSFIEINIEQNKLGTYVFDDEKSNS